MRGAILSIGVLLAAPVARAKTESFQDFRDVSPLALTGSASQTQTTDGWVLRLTPAVANQTGSAFGSAVVSAAQFYSSFSFRLSDPGGTDPDANGRLGADGFTFAIQDVSASLGNRGGGLGIDGVTPSVAVEFDTYRNADYNDPSSNHIGIDVDGVVTSVATVDVAEPFNDGNVWYAWIDCDANTITVSVSQDGLRPAVPQLSYPINVEQTLGSKLAYVGFTAATGGGFQNHDILSWVYLDHFLAADAGVPPLDGGDFFDAGGDAPPDGSADRPLSLDAAPDGSVRDRTGDTAMRSGGCGCDTGGPGASSWAFLVAGAFLPALRARRRARRDASEARA